MNPAFQLDGDLMVFRSRHRDGNSLRNILGPTIHHESVFAGWQRNGFTIGPIDLIMEEEVGGQPGAMAAGRLGSAGHG